MALATALLGSAPLRAMQPEQSRADLVSVADWVVAVEALNRSVAFDTQGETLFTTWDLHVIETYKKPTIPCRPAASV